MKTRSCLIVFMLAAALVTGCGGLSPKPAPTLTPAPTSTPACSQPGTTTQDRVPIPGENRSLALTVYLPPCYASQGAAAYPVLYWTAVGGQWILDGADALIRRGELPPCLVAMLDIDVIDGLGADGRIIRYVVPYVDAHYHTLPDPAHRSITGISHGAAIAARAALQPPNLFGRVAVISGGIANGEQEKFTSWLASTPPARRPAILVDVGDQDAMNTYAYYLTGVLDQLSVPYTFSHAPGGHSETYWDEHMPAYLQWLVPKG